MQRGKREKNWYCGRIGGHTLQIIQVMQRHIQEVEEGVGERGEVIKTSDILSLSVSLPLTQWRMKGGPMEGRGERGGKREEGEGRRGGRSEGRRKERRGSKK